MHNVYYQLNLMKNVREAIIEDRYPAFLKKFFGNLYSDKSNYPQWAVGALREVGVDLLED
jgi:queuine/archaeosine tRNA-ribosyltransferase